MTREEIKGQIVRNMEDSGLRVAEVRIQPDPYAGWHVVVISQDFSDIPADERRRIITTGLEPVKFQWLDLLTPQEREWAGVLPIDSDLEDLPLWPEALARASLAQGTVPEVFFPSELDEDIAPPIVATFYSMRGGVGRSTALAYTASILAARGRKVICVDMDLEAPGLAALFGKEAEIGEERGLVHLLTAFDRGDEPDVTSHLLRLSEAEEIYCLPAGRPDAQYARLLRLIDPASWYREERNPLHLLLDRLANGLAFSPDVILLDARTGITTLSGPLLFDLADLSVIVFFPHPQAETGTAALVRALLAARTNRRLGERSLTPEPRFLVSPVPASKAPEVVRRYEHRSLDWIARWLSELAERRNGEEGLVESDITHFVPYREAVATSDHILADQDVWRDFEPVADWIERFLPTPGEKAVIEDLSTQKVALLGELRFSTGTAEYQGESFLDTFVETDPIRKALDAKVPLVRGRKGTGKTAIFRRLSESAGSASIVVSAPGPLRGERPWLLGPEGFREVGAVFARTGGDWRRFWNLYTCLAGYFGWPDPASRPEPDRALAAHLAAVPATELEMVGLTETFLATPRCGLLASDWLARLDTAASRDTLFLLDGLDTGFGSSDEDRERRRAALEGLFSFLTDRVDALRNLRFKILLREDIWQHLRFENKSHFFGRDVLLRWNDKASFLKVILKQAVQSERFKSLLQHNLREGLLGYTGVDNWAEGDVFAAWNLLVGERMKGGKTTFTRNWVWNRLADSNGDHSPRYLLQLMHLATQWERREHRRSAYERSIVRPRGLVEVLPEVSEQALDALRKEEFRELEPIMDQLTRIGRTPLDAGELAGLNVDLLNLAREVGLLGVYEGSEENVERYKVPELFRWALKMKRMGQK